MNKMISYFQFYAYQVKNTKTLIINQRSAQGSELYFSYNAWPIVCQCAVTCINPFFTRDWKQLETDMAGIFHHKERSYP